MTTAADHSPFVSALFGFAAFQQLSAAAELQLFEFLTINGPSTERQVAEREAELARLATPTDAGAFLDISLDFVFYALFPLGFALADPAANALASAVLIASFVGTGASFLAFSAQAERHGIVHPDFGYKGLYYLDGLAEGTETVLCFVLMCLLPGAFAIIAWSFAALCAVTAANRVVSGYRTLRRAAR